MTSAVCACVCVRVFCRRGLNNDFLVRVSDDLALTYNDASPMENHHVAAAFRLARRPSYNFMRRMSRERVVGTMWTHTHAHIRAHMRIA